MKKLFAMLAAIFALVLSLGSSAQAYTTYPELDRVASTFAMRPVTVQCPTRDEWNKDMIAQGSWGYVWLGTDYTTMAPLMCEGALAITLGETTLHPWQRALGALVLIHESYHLRKWNWNGDEGRVQCQAIRHFKVGVQLLGGTKAEADLLAPYAQAFNWKLAAINPAYWYKACKVPWWYHL